jgi:hypothetical protein
MHRRQGQGREARRAGEQQQAFAFYCDQKNSRICTGVMNSEYDFIVVGGRCLDHRIEFCSDDI